MTTLIDETTMMTAGSTLTLNDSTFSVGVQSETSELKGVADLQGVDGVSIAGETIYLSKAGVTLEGVGTPALRMNRIAMVQRNSLPLPRPAPADGLHRAPSAGSV